MKYDVIIIGGAITGACTAHHLLEQCPTMRLCIIEADATYRFCATALSTAGVRVLFSQSENILMSRYGHDFYGDIENRVHSSVGPVDIAFRRQGYLFIANTADQADDMFQNYQLQIAHHCNVRLMTADQLKQQFPDFHTADVTLSVFSPNDGWIDPMAAVHALLKSIRAFGADIRYDRVHTITHDGRKVTGVVTEGGQTLQCDHLVNATGAWTNELSSQIGMKLPIEPLPRMVYYFEPEFTLQPFPLTLDGYGAGFRPEGRGYLSGVTEYSEVGSFCFEVNYDYFENVVWPKLAHRVPSFERIRLKSAWVGHYDQNTFDGNAIIGRWTCGLENYFVAAGSSGHGLQHAPAIGRAIAELIVDGKFQSIDLERLTYRRVIDNKPYPERGATA